MTIENNNAPIILALDNMVSADTQFRNASDVLHDAVKAAIAVGIRSVDLEGKPKGKWFNETIALLARQRLSPEDFALWNDATVKQRTGTPKHKLAMRLNSALGNIRDKMLEIETAEMEAALDGRNGDEPEKKDGATKAGQGTARPLAKRLADESGKLANAIERDRTGGEPSELPHELFIAAFKAIRAMAEKPERITAEVKENLSRWTDLVK